MSIFDIWKLDICPSWSYIYQDYQSCISLIKKFSTMAPRDLLQDTVEYNRKVNLARKVLKSKKYPLPTLPLMSVGPVQSGVPANAPVESGKVIRRHVASSKANNRLRMSKKPKNTKHMCNHVLYTPMAEFRRNYETVLSWLKPAVIKMSRGNIRLKRRQSRSAPESSELPSTRYRVSS